MELKIFSHNGTLKLTVSPSSSSTVTEEVMGECSASVNFTYTEYVQLEVNDYIQIGSVRYKIKSRYRPTKEHTSKYVYQVKFWAPIHDAEDALFLFTADGEMQSEFSYDASPREHLQMWVDNMNRNAGSAVWSIGTVISANNKTIEYKNTYCWDAAFGSNGIAAAFETEMWADGFVVNLCKAERGERVALGYMQGLTKLVPSENDSAKFFTRLYPLGSTRNIDASKYGYSRLQLPSKVKYLDRNTELYGIKDGYEEAAFADIYPRFTGTVSAVRTVTKTNESEREYTVYYIKDNTIDFNPNDYDLPEHVKKISFQTGDLAGRGDAEGSFEANWLQESKEWEIINVYPDEETQVPGGVLIPKVGDTYIPWNFSMPIEYNKAAEKEFEVAVDMFLHNRSFDPTKYEGQTDRNYIEKNNINLFVGLNVQLLSPEYFDSGTQESRIIKVVRKLNDLFQANIICSDKTSTGWKSSIDNSINDLKFKVSKEEKGGYDIIKVGETKSPSDFNVFSALRSLATFLRKDKADSTKFLLRLLGGAEFGEYVDGVKGAKIDTNGDIVTNKVASHAFTSGMFGSGFVIKKDADKRAYVETDDLLVRRRAMFAVLEILKQQYIKGDIIQGPGGGTCRGVEEFDTYYRCYLLADDGEKAVENTFDVDDQVRCQEFNIKPGVHENVSNQYYWRKCIAVGDDYIDLSKTDCDKGSMVPKAGDDMATMGNRTNPDRQNATVYGVYGNDAPYIKQYVGINSYDLTGKEKTVVSPNGNKFTGKFYFSSGEDVENVFKENISYVKAIEEELNAVKNQLDGNITTWFLDPVPSLGNEPYISWKDDAERDMHLKDLYFDKTGRVYRFEKQGGVYQWKIIEDEQLAKALADAKQAQDTADGKRRVFVRQPAFEEPYDEGDLWVNVSYSDGSVTYVDEMLRCVTAKPANSSFAISHWKKASDYTTESSVKARFNATNEKIEGVVESVSTINGTLTKQSSKITQTEKDIRAKVSKTDYNGNTVVSMINQTADNVSIAASKVNLYGQITFNELSLNLENTIKGKAEKSDLDNKANVRDLDEKADKSELSGFVKGSELGPLAKATSVLDAMKAETIIVGGYIDTKYINVSQLDASQIDASKLNVTHVNATTGSIGALNITERGLSNRNFSGLPELFIGDKRVDSYKHFCVDASRNDTFVEIVSTRATTVKIKNNGSQYALAIDRADGYNSLLNAIYARGSSWFEEVTVSSGIDISGGASVTGTTKLEPGTGEYSLVKGLVSNVRVITASGTVNSNDDILVLKNSSDITLTLASSIPIGKRLIIKQTNGRRVTFSNGNIVDPRGDLNSYINVFKDYANTFEIAKIESQKWLTLRGW